MISRRRFLAISAASLAAPAAQAHTWTGRALGANAKITLYGGKASARTALEGVRSLIESAEAAFSLYDPESELSRLNRSGSHLPSPMFCELFTVADEIHRATGGLFDPTVQPLWQAYVAGEDVSAAQKMIGWHRVVAGNHGAIHLADGQALTFNGIAQGYITDLAATYLRTAGFRKVLVNIGEFAGSGEPWRVGIADPMHGFLGYRTLNDGAIATSSPEALMLPGSGHIFHPYGDAPVWSTVSVEASSATLADGLSTALCLARPNDIRRIRARLPGVGRVTLVDVEGSLTSL